MQWRRISGGMPQIAAVELTMTATYSGCTFLGFSGVTIEMHSCEYVFETAAKEGSAYEVNTGVRCAKESDSITITAKLLGVTKCVVDIGPQEGLGSVTVEDQGRRA